MVVEKNENGHWSYKIQTLSHNILKHLWVAPTLQLTLLYNWISIENILSIH